jgi:hypothetical protein
MWDGRPIDWSQILADDKVRGLDQTTSFALFTFMKYASVVSTGSADLLWPQCLLLHGVSEKNAILSSLRASPILIAGHVFQARVVLDSMTHLSNHQHEQGLMYID